MPDWFICPIVGAGTDEDPYRVDHPGAYDEAIIPSDPVTGAPLNGWALCRLHSEATKEDDEHVLIPDRTVTLSAEQRNGLRNRVMAKGVPWEPKEDIGEGRRGEFHRSIAAQLWADYRLPKVL